MLSQCFLIFEVKNKAKGTQREGEQDKESKKESKAEPERERCFGGLLINLKQWTDEQSMVTRKLIVYRPLVSE